MAMEWKFVESVNTEQSGSDSSIRLDFVWRLWEWWCLAMGRIKLESVITEQSDKHGGIRHDLVWHLRK